MKNCKFSKFNMLIKRKIKLQFVQSNSFIKKVLTNID